MKQKWTNILILIAVVILAGIAVFTSIKLYQMGKKPVAPTAPMPAPAQEEPEPTPTPVDECTLDFNIPTPTPTPTPTSTPTPTPTSTPTPTPTPTSTPTPTPTSTPTPTPTPTSTPTPVPCTAACVELKVYDADWNRITDFSTITVGQTLHFAVIGSTNCSSDFTMGRFRINGGAWQETTTTNASGEFYISYTILSTGAYTVEAMIYHPEVGWR